MIQPKVLSLLLCDTVERSPTGRKSIFGLIDRIDCEELPRRLDHCTVFGRFGFGEGDFELRFKLKGPGDTIVFEADDSCHFSLSDTMQTRDIALELRDIVLKETGIYWIEAHICGKALKPAAAISVELALSDSV